MAAQDKAGPGATTAPAAAAPPAAAAAKAAEAVAAAAKSAPPPKPAREANTNGPDAHAAAPLPDLSASAEQVYALWARWLEAAGQSLNGATGGQAEAVLAQTAAQAKDLYERDPTMRALDMAWNANPMREVVPVDWSQVAWALRTLWLRSMSKPSTAFAALAELNASMLRTTMEAWNDATRRWLATPVPGGSSKPSPDKRFAAPEWQNNPAYRTLRDTYLLASDWLLRQGESTDGLDEMEQQRLLFHLRQFVDAMSPNLLLAANPVALKKAIETGGASVANGVRNLLADLQAGKLSMTDETAFAPGRNLALSPGKVVMRNKLIELIQYAPTTETVHATPLLILPPWINKFYIMDMQPKNSLVKFLTDQGFTVFMVSWKNPDASMDSITIEDYMDLGPLAASDAVRAITGADKVNVMGYCIGGTLLAMTLALLAKQGDTRFNSATFMVSLQDFTRVGDTAIFMGEPGIDFVEQQMLQRGYLDSREMSNMFNLLRANDLIWANVVNNYLLGEKPPAFDLLYWNSDGTRMARAAHAWYLHNTYLDNNLIVPNKIQLKGEGLDLGRITIDVYAVGAEKDHIVPWDAAWHITHLTGGKVRYVLASSGHIAGVINPPGGKGTYWINEKRAETAEAWRAGAKANDGSWWRDWAAWLAARAGARGKPPALGNATYQPLMDAPGSYVLER